MLQVKRREAIIKYLEEDEAVAVDKLAEKLDVSTMTIRRDLQYLEEQGIAKRTHGGAILDSTLTIEVPYRDKEIRNKDEKRRIAELAHSMIKNGQVVGLDAGTTTMEIAKRIVDMNGLTVVTPDVIIAGYLSQNSRLDVLCTGGYVQNQTGTCMGNITEKFLRKINIDIAFIGTSALDDESITTPTFEKAELKKQIINSSKKVVLTTDSSKYGEVNFVKICKLSDLDCIIMDGSIEEENLNRLRENEVDIKLV